MMSRVGPSRTNHAQMIPYISRDMKTHQDIYNALKGALADLFAWLEEKVKYICG